MMQNECEQKQAIGNLKKDRTTNLKLCDGERERNIQTERPMYLVALCATNNNRVKFDLGAKISGCVKVFNKYQIEFS